MGNDMMETIKAEAILRYPCEACGLIVKTGSKSITVACENVAEDKRNNFTVNANDYALASTQGEIIGVWHTHVEEFATPSVADRVSCNSTGVTWYIVSIMKRDDEFIYGTNA